MFSTTMSSSMSTTRQSGSLCKQQAIRCSWGVREDNNRGSSRVGSSRIGGVSKRRDVEPLLSTRRRTSRLMSRAVQSKSAKDTSGEKILLTRAEVPAFIPRDDFLQQLYQWAEISIGQRGRASYGYSMVVDRLVVDDVLKGFQVQVGNETTIEVGMDDQITEKYEFLSRGPDGFPVPKGRVDKIPGKYLEIRKADQNEISDAAKQAIRELISAVMKAFDSYYAFGSVFSHDST